MTILNLSFRCSLKQERVKIIAHLDARPEKVESAKMKAEVFLSDDYRPAEDEPFMNERQREYFRRRLINWKEEILRESKETLHNLAQETLSHADLADRASTEAERANKTASSSPTVSLSTFHTSSL